MQQEDIAEKDFPYSQFETCKSVNVIDCPKKNNNAECDKWAALFIKNIEEKCEKCKTEIDTLKEKDADNYKMPVSCSECYLEAVQFTGDEKPPQIIDQYYVTSLKSCATSGKYEKTYDVTKASINSCYNECAAICKDDAECKTYLIDIQTCENDETNLQCKAAIESFNKLEEVQYVNYPYAACKETCSTIEGIQKFPKISECRTQCLTKKIDTESFTLQSYLQCKNENVLICPSWDDECKTAVEGYSEQFEKLESDECKSCEEQKKKLQEGKEKDAINDILFPVSCVRCHTAILTKTSTNSKVANYYVSVMKDCAVSGKVEKESKYNKKQFQDCFANCDRCNSDNNCKKEQDKFKACVQEESNSQCKFANTQYTTLKDDDALAYPYIVCQESCRIKTDNTKYEQIQVCQDKCYIGEASEVEIEQKTFTFESFQICKDENLLICPEWDTQCLESAKAFENSLLDDNIEECRYCKDDTRRLKAKDDKLQFGFPTSCFECCKKVLIAKEDTPKKVQEFYLPIYRNCALYGSKERETKTLKSTFNQCKQKCDSCSSQDNDCKIQQAKAKKCVEDQNNKQCSFGQQQFTNAQDSEILPYSFVVCQESCRIETGVNTRFDQIQKCLDECYIGNDSDVDIDKQSFTYEAFLQCQSDNVPQCPPFNGECVNSVKRFQDALTDKNIENCALCESEKRILSKKQSADDKNGYKFPVSCTLCYNKVLIPDTEQDSQLIQNFYIPILRQCAQEGILDEQSQTGKTFILKYTTCVAKCGTCKGDSDCDAEESEHGKCKDSDDNSQCKYGRQKYIDATEVDVLPYPYIVCQQSCNIPTPKDTFKAIQSCKDKCMIKKESESDLNIEVQSFTYQEVLDCKAQNVMECDQKDEKCLQQLETYQQRINDNLQVDCEQCKIEQRYLKAKEQNTNNYKFPVSCSRCYNKQLVKIDDSPTSSFLSTFFLQNYKDCALFATIERTSVIKSTKEQFDKCKTTCDTCGSTTDCSIYQKKHSDCFNDQKNEQCQYGLRQYAGASKTDPLPYSYVVCKESCRQYEENVNPKYKKIQECFDKCYLGEEPDLIIDQNEDFTYDQFLTCRKNNVFQCPQSNEPCAEAINILQDRINKPTLDSCRLCKKERDYLESKQDKAKIHEYFMPISCIECYKEAIIIHKDDSAPHEVKQYYIPALRDCAIFGESQSKTKTTKSNFLTCSKTCDNCKGDKDCEASQKAHSACVADDDNDQCKYGMYTYTNAKDDDLLPVQYVYCKESCRQLVDETSKYQRIQKCFDNCYKDVSPPVVVTGDFKFSQFLECKKSNVIQCQKDNQACQDVVTRYEDKFDEQTNEKCQKCKQERDILTEDLTEEEQVQGNYYIPLSCQQCYGEIMLPNADDKEIYQDLKEYYFATYRLCAYSGKVEKKTNMNKEYYDNCINHCNICPVGSQACLDNEEKFTDCYSKSDSGQCKYAYDHYKPLQPSDQVPYNYIACRVSCKNPIPEQTFYKDIQICYDSCNLNIETKNFNYKSFLNCKQSFVLQCPAYNKACQASQTYYENKIANSQTTNCKKCRNELKLEQSKEEEDKKENLFQFPQSCSQCYIESLEDTDRKAAPPEYSEFTKYYVNNYKSCAAEGKIDLDSVGVQTTLTTLTTCLEKCPVCSSNECETEQNKFDGCQFETKNKDTQCYIGYQDFQEIDQDTLVPYSFVVCQQSCKIPSPDKIFDKRQKCLSSCLLHSQNTLDYTLSELDECISKYVAWPQKGSKSEEHKQFLETCLNNQNTEEIYICNLCYQMKKDLQADDYLPSPCKDCLKECNKLQNTQNHIYNEYIFKTYEKCYENPVNIGAIIEVFNDITYTEKCAEKCDQEKPCDKQSCKDHLKLYTECKIENDPKSQCNQAYKKLNTLKDEKKLYFNWPYEIEICREGCYPEMDSPDSEFKAKFDCVSDCSRVSEKDLFQYDFTNNQVNICLGLNLPDLPYQTDQKTYFQKLDTCYYEPQSGESYECQWCRSFKMNPDTKFYRACSDCMRKCATSITPAPKNNLQLFIQNTYLACYGEGELPEAQSQIFYKREVSIQKADQCISNKCPCEDEQCKLNKQKYQQFIATNTQCVREQEKFKTIDEAVYMVPFPHVVCKYAANDDLRLTSDQKDKSFVNYFQCVTSCDRTGSPPPVIVRKNFTILAHQVCVESYCPKFTTSTNQAANLLQKEFQNCQLQTSESYNINECVLCQDYVGTDKKEFYPQVCEQCRAKCLDAIYKQKGMAKSQEFTNLVEPCIKQCDANGTFKEPQNITNPATISSQAICTVDKNAEYCNITSPTYKDCQQDKKSFDECVQTSAQCKLALEELNGYIKNDEYMINFPYKLYLCHQGCKLTLPKTNDYKTIMTNREFCSTKYYEHQHDYYKHNTSQVITCIAHNSANCPPQDEYCRYQQKIYETCYGMKAETGIRPDCDRCQALLSTAQRGEHPHPTACSTCSAECMKVVSVSKNKMSEVFRTLIQKQVVECHKTAQAQDIFLSETNKFAYIQCKYDLCKGKILCDKAQNEKECQSDFKRYTVCKQGNQCSKSDDIYMNLGNSSLLDPSQQICTQSCLPDDAGFDFLQIYRCDIYCQESDYVPKPKPNPEPKPEPTTPDDKKDNKFGMARSFQILLLVILSIVLF